MTSIDPTRPFALADWLVDPALDEISRGGVRIKLEPRMMRLLCMLARDAGKVVSQTELLDHVWSGVIVGPNSVYQAIANLRRQLGDTDETARFIATVPRKGYRLVAEVRQPPDPPAALPAQVTQPPAAVAASARPSTTRSRREIALGIVAAMILAIGAWWQLRQTALPADRPTVAVLPFDDLSAEGNNEVFCQGLTDEVLNSLARIPNLRVIGRTSSSRFADSTENARQIGGTLGASHLLEGSVRRSGNRVRVSAQLVSTEDGVEVWANSYDRAASDALQIQSEIARAVTTALSLRLSPAVAERLASDPTSKMSAYDLYLLGRNQQQKRTPESLARAIEYHEAAIAADPGFALAHAGLADAQMARYYYAGASLEETAARVQPEVDAALRLDPELAEAYAAWAVLLTEQWRTDEAIKALQRAVAINPNYGEAYLRLGAAYEYASRPRDALAAYDQVALLDPLHTIMHVRRCLALQNLGRFADAERACQRAFELQPEIPNALWAWGLNDLAQGRLEAAAGHYLAALSRAPARGDIRAELVLIYLDLGQSELAREQLDRLRAGAPPALLRATAARYLLATSRDKIVNLPADLDSIPGESRRDAVQWAFLRLAGGDLAGARQRAAAALENRAALLDELTMGVYQTRWGVCDLCAAGTLLRTLDDKASAEPLERDALRNLDELEAAGHVWHGLHYLRAALQAQRGDATSALASLRRAIGLGWRRAWLMRRDPSFESVRGLPEYTRLLAQVDGANAISAASLAVSSRQ
ncbi:MAG: winged helix-turn-helix domain-containing protein [Steroidobacteraceae bacterium]